MSADIKDFSQSGNWPRLQIPCLNTHEKNKQISHLWRHLLSEQLMDNVTLVINTWKNCKCSLCLVPLNDYSLFLCADSSTQLLLVISLHISWIPLTAWHVPVRSWWCKKTVFPFRKHTIQTSLTVQWWRLCLQCKELQDPMQVGFDPLLGN